MRIKTAAGAAAAVLIALDLARPYVGTSLRPWQWLVALLLVALLAGVWRASGRDFAPILPAFALALLLVPTFVDHSRVLAAGDGMHYYSYLRSLLFDADLDLRNDYVLLGWHDPEAPNVLPVGAPLLWAPAVLGLHLLRSLARLFGAAAPTGVEPIYQAMVCFATLAYGSAALFLLWSLLRRWVSPWIAFWATVLCWVGSPVRFYLAVLPSLAHGVEFFGAVLTLAAFLRLRDAMTPRHAAFTGAACGLTFLARSQDGLLLLLPAAEIAWQAAAARSFRRGLRCAAALAGGFLLAALPQMAVWQVMFGAPVLIPHQKLHGADFLHTSDPQLLGALLSPRGGLFVTFPAMLAAVFGLLWLVRRERRYVVMLLPVLLAMWYLNASVFDWYQVRRFTGLVPFLAPALALLLVPVSRAGGVALAALAVFVWRYDVAVDARRSQPGDPVPIRAALREMGDGLARDAYRWTEPVSPRLAVWLTGRYAGAALLQGQSSRIELSIPDLALLRLPRPARHWSAVELEDGVACRWVTDREARLFLPLAWEGAIMAVLRARSIETDGVQTMEVVWNDSPLGPAEMTPEWRDYSVRVPADVVRAGTNVVVIRFARAPVFHRVRGSGPREMRAAAVAWIDLQRHTESR
jgi:hypothetical protein